MKNDGEVTNQIVGIECVTYIYICLVGGFNHLEKYESQWEGLSHILWETHA